MKFGFYLSKEEHQFVKDQGEGFVRGLVRREMENRPLDEKARAVMAEQKEMNRRHSAVSNGLACPECSKPYKNIRLLGAVCYNEKCPRYKEKEDS